MQTPSAAAASPGTRRFDADRRRVGRTNLADFASAATKHVGRHGAARYYGPFDRTTGVARLIIMTGGSARPTGAAPEAARCAIAVMAKSPLSGAVKTRLVPPLTAPAAAALSAAFLRDTTENIARAAQGAGPLGGIDAYLAYAPAGIETAFAGMLAAGTRFVLADGSVVAAPAVRGIGRALLHAAEALFANGYRAVCLVNADSPNLPTALLARAAAALAADGDKLVLGPAEDGGYYLIGMEAAHAELFADIAWSTDAVAAATRRRAQRLGLSVVELAPWYDVDDAATLRRLCRDLAAPPRPDGLEPYPAPATAGCLAALGLDATLGA